MKELIALLARNLEADETQAFTRDNGQVTLGTVDVLSEFHKSPHKAYCSFLRDRASDSIFRFWSVLRGLSLARAAQAKNALAIWLSACADLVRSTRFLLIVAEEEIVRAIGLEYLVTNVGRG